VENRAPLITAVPVSSTTLRTLAATRADRYPVFFDSAAEGPLARYSVLAGRAACCVDPRRDRGLAGQGVTPGPGGFFDNLEAWFRRERATAQGKPLPFLGGWFVYLGYEVAAEIESHLHLPMAETPFSAFALRVENIIVHELATDTVFAVSENGDAEALARLIADLQQADRHPFVPMALPALASLEEEPAELFLARVRAAQEHIAAGDIYQANLSRRWRLRLSHRAEVAHVYAALRRANPAPFRRQRSAERHEPSVFIALKD
jgi:anthranilate synthase component 1